jgi:CRISPR-associated protein Cas8a1/Csx13
MTELTLSIFDPNTLLPHRAGIAGLALALSEIDPAQVPFSWSTSEDAVTLAWQCSDKEAVSSLLEHTYRIQDGYLDVPALKLDQQGKYTFTEGVISSFLQHGSQRKLGKTPINLSFLIDEGQPEIIRSFKPLEESYYTGELKDIFSSKGNLKPTMNLKGQHLPGLVECFVNGSYQESAEGFLALIFLPLACGYYQLSGFRSALVIPEVKNIPEWVIRRKNSPARSYGDFRSSSSGESALRFLLQEKLIEDNKQLRVEYCEVYQLGKQQWDGNQNYLKQAVYRVQVSDEILTLYDSAFQFFKPQVRKNDKGETWLAISKVLPWLCDNLITGKYWYCGFFEFYKKNELYERNYERKGLISMTKYLNNLEQTFFDAVQGSFSSFLRGQIREAEKQGRQLDYKQVTNKIINTLLRPSTQQDFAKALVDFLSRHRSKATRGVGAEIYQWLHKDNNWKQARDLALLAIASYTGKSKEGDAELSAELLDELENEQSNNSFELSPM